jgi:hypothetical protein
MVNTTPNGGGCHSETVNFNVKVRQQFLCHRVVTDMPVGANNMCSQAPLSLFTPWVNSLPPLLLSASCQNASHVDI